MCSVESDGRALWRLHARALLAGVIAILTVYVSGTRAHAQAWGGAGGEARGDTGVVEALDDGDGAADDDRPWVTGVAREARERAYKIFLAGNEDMKEALFAKGAEQYKAALALWDHPAFHYNLGIARMNLDKIIEAYGSFERSREHGPVPIGEDKYELAEYYMNLLRNQLAELDVVCNEPGAAVALDGKPLFIAPGRRRVMVRPGGHRVEATKAQREPDIQEAVLDPGDSKQVTLAPQYPEYLATTRRWSPWVPWAVVGAGATAMLLGGALDLKSSADFRAYDEGITDECAGYDGCLQSRVPDALRGQLDRAELEQQLARGFYIAGGLTFIAGTAILFINRERIVRRRGPVERSDIAFTPVFTPHLAGVSARLRF